MATSPQDIRGLGTFSVRYNQADSKKPEDAYAYLKSVRRVRRLSGRAWMDPIGGTDQMYDDSDIWDAAPTNYRANKLIEKRWILAIAHSPEVSVDKSQSGKSIAAEYPTQGIADAPYFLPNKNVEWEPREVSVEKGTPPLEHSDSKKLDYMEVGFLRPNLGYALH